MRNTLFSISFFLLSALSAAAQGEPRFYTEVNATEIAVGEPLKVSFILENGQNNGRFNPPDWEAAGFMLLGSSQSSSISIMNGERSASATYHYTVSPLDTGTLIIPSVSIQNGDGELHTEPITIRAFPGSDGVRPALPKRSPATPQPEPRKKIKTVRI